MVLGIVALIFVGPKELPGLLRTIGKYAGILKKQATEFRSHFDQALKEAELDQLKNDITGFKSEVEGIARDTFRAAQKEAEDAGKAIEDATKEPAPKAEKTETGEPEPDEHAGGDLSDENGLPIPVGPVKPATNVTMAVATEESLAAMNAATAQRRVLPASSASAPAPATSAPEAPVQASAEQAPSTEQASSTQASSSAPEVSPSLSEAAAGSQGPDNAEKPTGQAPAKQAERSGAAEP